MNPYSATTHATNQELPGFRWGRVVAWSFLILLAVYAVGFLSGLTMTRWTIYGATIEEAVLNARLVRWIGYGVVTALLYWRFAAPLTKNRWLHVLAAFVLIKVLEMLVSAVIFRAPASELIDVGALSRSSIAALVGLGLASLGSNNSSKPTPLRGAA